MAGLTPVEIGLMVLMALASLALLAVGLVQSGQARRVSRRLAALDAPPAAAAPAEGWAALQRLGALLVPPGSDRQEIVRYLAEAGFRNPDSVAVFGLARLGAALAAAALAALSPLSPDAGGVRAWIAPVMFACVVFLGAKQALKLIAARRQRKINAELPFTLDILVMMLESGVSIDQCFRAFAQGEGRAAPTVQEAVGLLVRDIQHGASYDVALQRWAQRLGVPGAHELANVIRQALSHGTPLARVLREFSREFAERRVALARESLGKKSTQMTLVMLLLIMPALFIVLAGPAVSTLGPTMRSLTGGP